MSALTPAPDWIVSRPIAHRGFHDLSKGRAENSMGAFAAAMDARFAIEFDVQNTKDNVPVVFHDRTLKRMTSENGNVRDHTVDELSKIHLLDTQDTIRTLADHLELVAGKVPLIIELKGVKGEDAGFVEGVAEALKNYDGEACVMSFNHWICAQFKSLLPNLPRGLTAQGGGVRYKTHQKAMEDYDLQFISYNKLDLPTKFVRLCKEAALPVLTWTILSVEEREEALKYVDQITFEEFDPRDAADGR